ncbi:MGMT family protein [Candidatus Woesearchaeota archaeon]|nr:MGMT family protein [Candidatus Woesearchaeota archaeon]
MLSSFSERVWKVTKKIPRGSVATYKDIAYALHTKAYRAVGNALNKNPHAPIVPCHRVVKSDGGVGGFAHGTVKKITLLQKEGVIVKNGKVVEFEKRKVAFSSLR